MARGTLFSVLQSRVRSETARSDNLAVGVDDLHVIKQKINSNYQTLYMQYDWPHLKKVFTRFPLNAGQQYYDFPTGLNSERVTKAVVWRDGINTELTRGIDFDDYSLYDSDTGTNRAEPALKWDAKWTGSSDQIEIWPLPSTNVQQAQFLGFQAAPRLVADTDVCLLDDDLVVAFAAADLLGEKAGKLKLSQGQEHLRQLKVRPAASQRPVQMGLGRVDDGGRSTVVLRIGHS